ncbi:MAG TPA: NDP-sugar synthase [Vicinamibacterales bacterium]|nr:NDP-sugar synthase [Vicinamibacterales bacterium]
MVPALVLTAGLATRLRPLSFVRAKAALPVAGTPLIHRILRPLRSAGVQDVVLNLHYLPRTLTSLLGDGSALGMRIRYSWEVPVLGSAGGPKRAIPLLANPESRVPNPESRIPDPGTFLILNGDTLTDVSLPAVLDDHRRSGALVTMAVVPNTEPEKYSGVGVGPDGAFTGWVPRGSREPSYHFIGVQVAEPAAFASVPADTPSEVRTLYPALVAARRGAVRAFRTQASFMDIGTPSDYLETSLLLAAREGIDTSAGAEISPTARIERSILWDDVIVEDGAMLKDCVVTDGVRVPADTSWHGVTIRVASTELTPGERRIEGLAIGSL